MILGDQAHILVVDDEETMRRSLADILRLEGYQVEAAATGKDAVMRLQARSFDLMLLDLKMPGMDGVEVLDQATQISPQTKVIFLTAHGSLESAITALRHEVFDYLLKPSSPQQILTSVRGALARRSEEQQKQLLLEQLDVFTQPSRPYTHPDQNIQSLGRGVMVNLARRELWQEDDSGESRRVSLTQTEGKLFRVLLEHRGQVLMHRELVLRVQGYEVTDWEAPEVLRPLVSRLRQKLSVFEGGSTWITNVRGTGYVFELF